LVWCSNCVRESTFDIILSYFEKVGSSTADSETFIEIAPPAGLAGNVELNTTTSPPAQTFLFDPSKIDAVKKAKNRVRDWVLHNLPDALKRYLAKDPAGVSIFANEVNCGNARCAPVHVSIAFVSKEPGKFYRTIDIPKALADVRQKDVADSIDFVSDDLLACITDDPPTRKRRRSAYCIDDSRSRGFFGKLLRVHDSATDALLAAVAKVMEEEPDYADQIEGNFNASHTERMKALVEAVLAYYHADQVDGPAALYQKLVNVGAPPLVFRLLGKSVDAERELRGLDELLHRIKDVVVLNCDDLEPLILMAIEEAAAMAQELWRHGQIGRVAFDTNVPMPLELLEVAAAKVGGERTDMLLKVMAERRRDFLMKASPSDGKCVTCPVCLKELAPEKMRAHFSPRFNADTACYEELLKILDDDGCKFWYCGEGPKGGCGDRFCARRRPRFRNQQRWPFILKKNRDRHERRGDVVFYCDGIGCRLGDNCRRRPGLGLPFKDKRNLTRHKTGCRPGPGSLRFEVFDEDVEVYVDYVGSHVKDPIKRARGFIKKLSGGSPTIKFDDPALGEPAFRCGFKLTRLSDGVTYERKPRKGGGNDPSKTGTMVGSWSEEEHAQFLELMEIHGGSVTEVARHMETRKAKNVRAHFHRVGLVSGWKPEGKSAAAKRRRRASQ